MVWVVLSDNSTCCHCSLMSGRYRRKYFRGKLSISGQVAGLCQETSSLRALKRIGVAVTRSGGSGLTILDSSKIMVVEAFPKALNAVTLTLYGKLENTSGKCTRHRFLWSGSFCTSNERWLCCTSTSKVVGMYVGCC